MRDSRSSALGAVRLRQGTGHRQFPVPEPPGTQAAPGGAGQGGRAAGQRGPGTVRTPGSDGSDRPAPRQRQGTGP